jgi:hypothetical protein
LWTAGDPIIAHTDRTARLVAFRWNDRDHQVETIVARWRVDIRWWRRRVWRDYFEMTTYSGLMVVVYHDLISDRWFLQRLYD